MKLRFTLLMSACIGVFWAIGAETSSSDLAVLQKSYTLEQSKIDLTLAEFSLEAAEGSTPAEEVQDKIDRWMRDNGNRLQAQTERAAKLDNLVPLPSEANTGTLDDPLDTSGAARLRELEALEEQRKSELRTRVSTAEDFQMEFDKWFQSEEGQAVFAEKSKLFEKSPHHQPLGTQTVVLEVAANASQDELAVLEIEERMARRIQEIRHRNPDADPEKMQGLIDAAKDEFEADHQQIGKLMQDIRRADLVETVERLRAEISLSGSAPRSSR